MRVLFAPWDGGGNVPPALGVARLLVARGHAVHVLADPTVEPEARAAGATFEPWTTAPHRMSRHRSADIIRDYETANVFALLNKYMDQFMGAPAPRWAADTWIRPSAPAGPPREARSDACATRASALS